MRRYLLTVVVVVLFLPLPAYAYCHGVTQSPAPIYPDGNVCGEVYHHGFNGAGFVAKSANTSFVRLCPAGTTTNCSTTTTSTYYDAYGRPVQAYLFYRFAYGATQTRYYDVYTWDNDPYDGWGSQTIPVRRNVGIGSGGNEGMTLWQAPRPLDPTPLYPSGTSVPPSYTVTWMSGRNQDREPYNMTYEIWYKHWDFGGTEPANFLLARSGMPCHDDGTQQPNLQNQCDTFVAGPQLPGNWKWYVVANLDASPWFGPGMVLRTQSGVKQFAQPY